MGNGEDRDGDGWEGAIRGRKEIYLVVVGDVMETEQSREEQSY